MAKTEELTPDEENRRAKILQHVGDFDNFLRTTKFEAADLKLLDKTLEHWMAKVIIAKQDKYDA